MHILVTGGCGYIGSVLTPKLLNLGHRVTVFDIMWFGRHLADHENLRVIQGDIRDVDSVPMEGIDAIIHLANIANDPCGDLNAKLAWEVNVLATMGLVEKAIKHNAKRRGILWRARPFLTRRLNLLVVWPVLSLILIIT